MKGKRIIWIIVILVIGLIGFRLFTNKQQVDEHSQLATSEPIVIPVKTAKVKQTPVHQEIVKTGNLVAHKEIEIGLPVGGKVEQVSFELGDQVKKGEVLAVIDSKMNQLELEKANLKVKKLKNDQSTYEALYEGQATTREKLTEVQQSYDEAVNQVKQLRQQISDATVTAPIDGVMASRLLEAGSYASTGTKLGVIVDLTSAKVEVSLTEREAYQVKKRQQVKITTHVYPEKVFEGTLTFISPLADAAHNYTAEISLDVPKDIILRSGTFVDADFSVELDQSILSVPREALVENLSTVSVYVNQGNVAKLKPVVTGRQVDDQVEILQGLSEGDEVITAGQINLKDRAKISVSN